MGRNRSYFSYFIFILLLSSAQLVSAERIDLTDSYAIGYVHEFDGARYACIYNPQTEQSSFGRLLRNNRWKSVSQRGERTRLKRKITKLRKRLRTLARSKRNRRAKQQQLRQKRRFFREQKSNLATYFSWCATFDPISCQLCATPNCPSYCDNDSQPPGDSDDDDPRPTPSPTAPPSDDKDDSQGGNQDPNIPSECSDGIDNDGDGLIDWEYDLGCTGEADTTEGGITTGNLDNGWTVFEPSEDTQVIYVSSSAGDDSWSGRAPEWNGIDGPKKTLSAGYTELREGYPDWLLLKRGDTWDGEIFERTSQPTPPRSSGRSALEPLVIATYGKSSQRPIIQGFERAPFRIRNTSEIVNNVALVGLHFYGSLLDPNSPDFNGTGVLAVDRLTPGDFFHIEDCHFEYTGIQISSGAVHDFTLRRSIIHHNYSASGGHAQGMYLSNVQGALLEENVFDHNGWSSEFDLLAFAGSTDATQWATINNGRFRIEVDGTPYDIANVDFSSVTTMDETAVILQTAINTAIIGSNPVDVSWHHRVFKLTANVGTQERSIDLSMFQPYQGPVAGTDINGQHWLMGPYDEPDEDNCPGHYSRSTQVCSHNTSPDPTQFNHNVYIASGSRGISAVGNIFLRASASAIQSRPGGNLNNNFFFRNPGGGHVGRTSSTPVPGGVEGTFLNNVILEADIISPDRFDTKGFEFAHIKNFLVDGNIVARTHYPNTGGNGIQLGGSHEGIKDLTLSNNIIYDWDWPIITCCETADYNSFPTTVRLYNNDIQSFGADNSHKVIHVKHNDDYTSHFEFSGNTYWSNANQTKWFRIGQNLGLSELSFEEWTSHLGESSALQEQVAYPDPNRSLDTYHQSLGRTPTVEAVYGKIREQSKYNWKKEYTAESINSYMREGFGR